ncbi:hypothetical protein TWF730_003648 [Orbilia blumenaviensis]|uniref:Uncharacterized protein n=1 Tax=Orbilia blumenaviensis TaxID=1796055 RepID=A0AAV9U494_9PEZI
MPEPHSTWHFMPLLILITQLTSSSTAYRLLTFRPGRPNWFKSWNYMFDARPLISYEPDKCYQASRKFEDGDIGAVAIYNSLVNDTAISGLALYHSKDCGEGGRLKKRAYQYSDKPLAIIRLDAFDPYGINVVDLAALNVKWPSGSWKSVDIAKEHEGGGLLEGMEDSGDNGLVVWEADPNNPKVPYGRVWVPDVVSKVPEPRDFIDAFPAPDRRSYIYLRDRVERFLEPDSNTIPDVVTEYFDNLLAKKWKPWQRPLIRGPLHNPDDPKPSSSEEGNASRSEPPMEFSSVRRGVVPGMIYYKNNPTEMEELFTSIGLSEIGNNMEKRGRYDDAGLEPEDPINGIYINDEFQRFISDEIEPHERVSGLGLMGYVNMLEGDVQEPTMIQEDFLNPYKESQARNDMEIENEAETEEQIDQPYAQQNVNSISDERRVNQIEEEIPMDEGSQYTVRNDEPPSSPSVSDWPPGDNQEPPNERVEQNRIQQGNMVVPIMQDSPSNSYSNHAETSTFNLNERLQDLYDLSLLENRPFASTSSSLRRRPPQEVNIEPPRQVNIRRPQEIDLQELEEEFFTSSSQRRLRPRVPQDHYHGPQSSPNL